MLNNLDTLLKAKKLEVAGLSLIHQAGLVRSENPLNKSTKEAYTEEYRGLKEPEIQEIKTLWRELLSDPSVKKHVLEKEEPNAQEYVSTVLAPHLAKFKPYILKLLLGLKLGMEDVSNSMSRQTVTLYNANRFINDIFPKLQKSLEINKPLTPADTAQLDTIRRQGVMENLIGMAEQLLAVYNEPDENKKSKLLTMDSLFDEHTHRATISDSPYARLVFASETLDKVAGELQSRGHTALAIELDRVANTLESQH